MTPRRVFVAVALVVTLVGPVACNRSGDGIPDPASVDLSGVERPTSLECASLRLDHADLLKATTPAAAKPFLDRLLEFEPPDEVVRALEFQAAHAGDNRARADAEGTRAYDLTVRWKDAACPVAKG